MEIMIKYGELNTKKDNKKYFIKTLKENLITKFQKENINCEITTDFSNMYINIDNNDLDNTKKIIDSTFGIHSYSVIDKTTKKIEDIEKKLIGVLKSIKFKTFKIITKRSDKNYPINSIDFSKKMGGVVLKNFDVQVDVHNPELIIYIEIKQEFTLIYTNTNNGLGGYPVGVQKHALLMLSGGIDSPVAGYLAAKRGIKLKAIYFESLPHTSLEAREKVISLANIIANYSGNIDLYVVPFTEIQREIYKNADANYGITLMRRAMYRLSEMLAIKTECLAIINGESIGQVASQTLTSMNTINEVTNFPIIRPLACYDKEEIIKIAKEINTYETSILPYEDCCTLFVPKHPSINPKLDKCYLFEEKIDLDYLLEEAINNNIKIKIPNNSEFKDLL